jgi:hypothetical protein
MNFAWLAKSRPAAAKLAVRRSSRRWDRAELFLVWTKISWPWRAIAAAKAGWDAVTPAVPPGNSGMVAITHSQRGWAAFDLQRIAAAEPGRSVIGLEGQRLIKPGDGLGRAVLFGEGHGEVELGASVRGTLIERAGDEPSTFGLKALLAFGDPQQMQRIELGGIVEQDLPVQRLGAGEFATVLQDHGIIQGRVRIGFQRSVYLCLPVSPDAG